MKEKNIIGIDIDNTMTKLYENEVVRGLEFCKEHNLKTDFNPAGINVKEMYNIPEDLYKEYMTRYFRENVNCIPLRDYCADVISVLHIHNPIHIITARDANYQGEYTGQEMVEDTYNYFNKHQIPVDAFHFSSSEKDKVCKENGIKILIEDDPKHIKECAENGIIVIAMSLPYNQHMRIYENVIFVDSWLDVAKVVQTLKFYDAI